MWLLKEMYSPLKTALKRMEKKRPSGEKVYSGMSKLRAFFVNDKLNPGSLKSKRLNRLGRLNYQPNDYHYQIPEGSNIKGYQITPRGRIIMFKNGDSELTLGPVTAGYVHDFRTALCLAGKGDPKAEFYLERGIETYLIVHGTDSKAFLPFYCEEKTKRNFKMAQTDIRKDIEGMLVGIAAVNNITPIATVTTIDGMEGKEFHVWGGYAIQYAQRDGLVQGSEARIHVKHNPDNKQTTLEREAFGMTLATIGIEDKTGKVFENLYAQTVYKGLNGLENVLGNYIL